MIILKKRLRRAKFRDAWFFLNDTATDTGRRVSKFEMPYQDKPLSYDLGKRGQTISISGFIIGANYRADSERLTQACEQKGTGKLFHPYYGTRDVLCSSVRVSENSIEGGIVYFSMQFLETVDTQSGKFGFSSVPLLEALLPNDILEGATSALSKGLEYADFAPSVLDQLNDSVLASTELLERVFSPILHTADSMNNFSGAISELRRSAARIYTNGIDGIKVGYLKIILALTDKPLDEVSPYHWLRTFPPERFNFDDQSVRTRIVFVTQAMLVSVQASSTLARLESKATVEKTEQLQALKKNVDITLSNTESQPELHSKLKVLQSHCIELLYQEGLKASSVSLLKVPPKKCLLLEAYDRHGNLSRLSELKKEYHYKSACYEK